MNQEAGLLPEGENWLYELKLDGYRALAIKTGGKVQLRSRNDNDLSLRDPAIAKAPASIPDETALDGEIVALDSSGKPSFNTLQNYGSTTASLFYLVFDVLFVAGTDVMAKTLLERRAMLESASGETPRSSGTEGKSQRPNAVGQGATA